MEIVRTNVMKTLERRHQRLLRLQRGSHHAASETQPLSAISEALVNELLKSEYDSSTSESETTDPPNQSTSPIDPLVQVSGASD
jgi:hypothetical protein